MSSNPRNDHSVYSVPWVIQRIYLNYEYFYSSTFEYEGHTQVAFLGMLSAPEDKLTWVEHVVVLYMVGHNMDYAVFVVVQPGAY